MNSQVNGEMDVYVRIESVAKIGRALRVLDLASTPVRKAVYEAKEAKLCRRPVPEQVLSDQSRDGMTEVVFVSSKGEMFDIGTFVILGEVIQAVKPISRGSKIPS
jgi:hypothetical protein